MAEFAVRLKRGSKKMQYIIDQYLAGHPNEGPDVMPWKVAEWAVPAGIYKPLPIDPTEQLRRLLCRSLRETYMRDPQGREVRANLPIIEEVVTRDGIKRGSHWYPLFKAPQKVARLSFALRRRAAFADIQQLHFDFMSYNDNNEDGVLLDEMDYNFNADLADTAQPTSYPEGPEIVEDEEDEDEEL
ncbi:MAG TPA: hypothetical protein VKG25_29330 [Bryobacteraceae bacterium]|nr:hypothetical protein [Bryobacteraceae bacterium]